jgi:hypothetical protein
VPPDDTAAHGTGSAKDTLRIEVPNRLSEQYWNRATQYQFWYSVIGLIIGAVCVILGVALFFHGIIGSTSWTANIPGAKSELSDAAPNVIFAVLGLFVIWATRFKVRIRTK